MRDRALFRGLFRGNLLENLTWSLPLLVEVKLCRMAETRAWQTDPDRGRGIFRSWAQALEAQGDNEGSWYE
jgi:hypothetical protein